MPRQRPTNLLPYPRTRLALERLEDRTTPAVNAALNGTTLAVTLDAAGDEARLGVNGANLEVRNRTNALIFATPAAGVTALSFAGTATGVQSVVWNDAVAVVGAAVTGVSVLTVNGTYTITNNLAVTLGGGAGGVSDGASGVLYVGNVASFNAGTTRDVILDNATGHSFGIVAFPSAGNVVVQGQAGLSFGASAVGGTLTGRAAGTIGQVGALTVAGAATFDAGAANDITLTSTNDFASVAIGGGRNVTVRDINDLQLGPATVAALLAVTSDAGAITQSGAVVTPVFSATTAAGLGVTLPGANDFGTLFLAVGGNATINDVNGLALSGTVGSNLNATAAGALTDAGVLTVGGAATLAGASVAFDNVGDFQGVVTVASAAGVVLIDANDLAVGSVTATGGVTLSVFGAIVDANGAATNVAAASLVATAATGIGSGDALETAVATLSASNNAQGNIEITNAGALAIVGTGVSRTGAVAGAIRVTAASPLTVNAPVVNTTGGDIVLVAVNDGGNDDNLTVNATITASGGNGSITLDAGTDLILNDGGAATDISTAGTGAIVLRAVRNAFVNANVRVATSGGPVLLSADDVAIDPTAELAAPNGIIAVTPTDPTRTINLGTNAANQLGLTDAELKRFTAATLRIGTTLQTGGIVISAPVAPTGVTTLSLQTAGAATAAAGITVSMLAVRGNAVDLAAGTFTVGTLAVVSTTTGVAFTNTVPLTVGSVDGVVGITAAGPVTLTTDQLTIAQPIDAGANRVTLQPRTAGQAIDLGASVNPGNLILIDADLDRVTAGTLQIGNGSAGPVGVNGPITQAGSGYGAIVIRTGANVVNGGGSLTVSRLAIGAATGIGTAATPLATAAANFEAESATGGIFVGNNGDLTVGGVDAAFAGVRTTNAGDIVLTTAGNLAVNLAGEIVSATGAVALAANGAASDLLTGGGQTAVVANGGPLTLVAGHDLRLGGATAAQFGHVRGVGVTLTAGNDIVLDGDTFADATGAGALTANAGRDITVTGVTSGTGPRFTTAGGPLTLTAPRTFTLAAGAATPAVSSAGGDIAITADDMAINRGIDAGAGCVILQPFAPGRPVDLGTETPGSLSLTAGELAQITASATRIGRDGPVAVTAPLTFGTLVLVGTTLTQTAPLTVTNLGLQFTGAVTLDADNQITRVGGTAGSLSITNATPLSIGTFVACGILFDRITTAGDVTITADTLEIVGPIEAPTFCVTLQQRTPARLVDVGTETVNRLSLTDAELDRVTARVLRIGRPDGGAVEVTAAVSPANADTLVLRSAASVSEVGAGTLAVPNLAIQAGTTATLTGPNAVTNLAGVAPGGFAFVNGPDLTVTAIDTCDPAPLTGVTTTDAPIDLTVTGAGNRLTVLSPVNAGNGAVTLTADDMTLAAAVSAGTQRAILQPNAAGRAIDLGADTAGTLGLTDAEFDLVTAGMLQVGRATAGRITARAAVSPGGTTTLALQTGADVADQNASGSDITVTNLAVRAVTGVGDPLDLAVTNLAFANTNNAVGFADVDGLTVIAVDGLATSSNSNGDIAITTTGPLTFAVDVTAGGSLSGIALETTPPAVNVSNLTVNANVTLRATAGDLNLLAGDRIALNGDLIAGQSVRLASASGDNDGDGQQTLAGNVTAGTRVTLDVGAAGGAMQTGGAVTAPQLLLLGTGAGGNFTLAQAGNDVDTLAAATAAAIAYRDADDLTVGTVGTTNGLTAGGDVALQTGPLTLGPLTAVGRTVDINAAGIAQTAPLNAANLRVRGTGTFSLLQANDVDTLAADVTGTFAFRDADDLTVGTVLGTAGIRTAGINADVDAVTLVTRTNLTVNAVIDAGGPGGGRIAATSGTDTDRAVVTVNADLLARRATFTGGNASAGNLGDTFQILPSATTPIFIDGRQPTQMFPGDALRLTLQRGETGTRLTPGTPGNGVFTFDNRQPVTFTEIESLNQANLLAFVLQTGPANFQIGVFARIENSVSGNVPVTNIPNNTFVVSPQMVNPFQPFGAPRLAVGDVNGDGIPDLIVAFGPNNLPLVTVFDGGDVFRNISINPRVLAQFYAYDPRFVGGLFVAAADFNGDGRAEMVLSPDQGGGPHVRVLFLDPNVADVNHNVGEYAGPGPHSFLAFDPGFHGGVRVATGDVSGDGTPDLIAAAGPGGGPHVRTFDGRTGQQLAGPLGSFFAYEGNFRGGVFVAAGDYNNDGRDDIMTGPGFGGAARVRIFSGLTGDTLADFNAFPNSGGGGSIIPGEAVPMVGVGGLAFADVNGDGLLDILVGTGRGVTARLRTFRGNGANPTMIEQDSVATGFLDGYGVASFGQ